MFTHHIFGGSGASLDAGPVAVKPNVDRNSVAADAYLGRAVSGTWCSLQASKGLLSSDIECNTAIAET